MVKVKVKSTLAQSTKTQRKEDCTCNATFSLTTALFGGSRAPAVLPTCKGPGRHCTRSWLGPRDSLDDCG